MMKSALILFSSIVLPSGRVTDTPKEASSAPKVTDEMIPPVRCPAPGKSRFTDCPSENCDVNSIEVVF